MITTATSSRELHLHDRESLEKLLEDRRGRLDELSNELTTSKQRTHQFQTEIPLIVTKLKSQQMVLEHLKRKIESENDLTSTEEIHQKNVEGRLTAQVENLRKQVQEYSVLLQREREAKLSIEDSVNKCEQDRAETMKNIKSHREDIKEQRAESVHLQRQLTDARLHLKHVESDVKREESVARQLQIELETLKMMSSDVSVKKNSLQDALDRLKRDKQRYEKQLTGDYIANQMRKDQYILNSEIARLTTQIDDDITLDRNRKKLFNDLTHQVNQAILELNALLERKKQQEDVAEIKKALADLSNVRDEREAEIAEQQKVTKKEASKLEEIRHKLSDAKSTTDSTQRELRIVKDHERILKWDSEALELSIKLLTTQVEELQLKISIAEKQLPAE